MVFASLVVVSVAAARPSLLVPPSRWELPLWMAGPLGYLSRWYHPGTTALRLIFSIAVAGMFVCYLLIVPRSRQIGARWTIGAVVALHLIFFLAPPLALTDVFNYINYGRMEIVHHLNPYTSVPVIEEHSDPSYLISNWHHLPSPYGPLFTIFTFALVPVGVAAAFWLLKATLMAASLASLWLVWRCAELLGRDPLRATLFVGLNPVVLLWGLGGDHNDFVMMFFLLLAFYLLLRARALRLRGRPPPDRLAGLVARLRSVVGEWRYELGAGVALVAAVAIKASAALLLPIIVLGVARRLRLVGGLLAGAVIFGAATLIAFGPHIPNLSDQSSQVTTFALPNLIGYIVGAGGETGALKAVADVVLLLAVIGCALWAGRSGRWLAASGWATVALLATLSWTLPWYVLWLLPLAALARTQALRTAATVAGVFLLVTWSPISGTIFSAAGFTPAKTALGKLHQHEAAALLH
jgi:type IV secretory pathway TrbD component